MRGAIAAPWDVAQRAYDVARERFWRAAYSPVPSAGPLPLETDGRLARARVDWPSRHPYRDAHTWVDPIRTGLSRYIFVRTVESAPPDSGKEALPVTFTLALDGRCYPVTIDYSDYMDSIYEEQARSSLLYFKMQYRRPGYADLGYDESRIIPGGYVTVSPHLYRYLRPARRRADQKRYSTDVYGRFTLRFAAEIRQRAHTLLSEQSHFRYRGSLANVRYSRFLQECAEARICLDLPGNGDFCFRLVDYLAVGCCVVAPKHRTKLPVDLQDRTNIVYVRRDLSDLIETCRYYLAHDGEREAIGRNAREYFDRHLHRDQLAGYILRNCLQKIERGTAATATPSQG